MNGKKENTEKKKTRNPEASKIRAILLYINIIEDPSGGQAFTNIDYHFYCIILPHLFFVYFLFIILSSAVQSFNSPSQRYNWGIIQLGTPWRTSRAARYPITQQKIENRKALVKSLSVSVTILLSTMFFFWCVSFMLFSAFWRTDAEAGEPNNDESRTNTG